MIRFDLLQGPTISLSVRPNHVIAIEDISTPETKKSRIHLSSGISFEIKCDADYNKKQLKKHISKANDSIRTVASFAAGCAGALVGLAVHSLGIALGLSLVLLIAIWMRWHR